MHNSSGQRLIRTFFRAAVTSLMLSYVLPLSPVSALVSGFFGVGTDVASRVPPQAPPPRDAASDLRPPDYTP